MAEEYFIVSLDFDGTLAHGYKVKIKYAKQWFDVDLDLNQTKKEGFDALMKSLGKKISYRDLMDPLNEQHIMEYEPAVNCVNVLSKLYSQSCRFVIITSRNNHDYPYAVHFVNETFDGLIKYIHNTRNESKGSFVKKLKPRIHIDDDIDKLIDLADLPIELIYFRQPENIGQDIPSDYKNRISEANNFDEVMILINTYKELHSAICWKNSIPNNWTNISRIFAITHSLSKSSLSAILLEWKTLPKAA